MERTTFCLLFYIRRTKLNRNGEAPIMMRITVNGVRVDASVKKTILPEFWSAAKGKALEKKREYKELNLYLDSIRLRIMKIQRELEIEKVSVSANSVLDRFQGKDAPVQRTLFEVFREHNDKCVQLSGTDMAPATVQRYETSLKHTRDFVCVLGLQNPEIVVTGFDRENLYYRVESIRKKDNFIIEYVEKHAEESGIIYCATRKNVDEVYELLWKRGVPVAKYHAGMDSSV